MTPQTPPNPPDSSPNAQIPEAEASFSVIGRMPQRIKSRIKAQSSRWLLTLSMLGVLLAAMPVLKVRSATESPIDSDTEAIKTGAVLPVETVRATQSDFYQVSRVYTGEVAALQASELGFERSGQLMALLVPEGTQVQAGEAIAQLDVQNLQTQRLQIEAEKARALAQLSELEVGARSEDIAAAEATVRDFEQQIALQKTQLARREILFEQGAIAQEALDEFSFGAGALQARLDQAQSQLNALQNGTRPEQIQAQVALVQQLEARIADIDVNLAKSTLIAPFSGTVAAHNVDLGTVIGAGQSVVRLVENSNPEARVGVPADEVRKLTVGEERTVAVGGEQYTGTISAILPEVTAQTRTQTVVLALEPRAAGAVSPGQTMRLTLSERVKSKGIWLPAEAITQGVRGLWTAYVAMPTTDKGISDYAVEPQSVEVVHQEGDRVFVTGTLQPDALVVATGAHRLVPGQRVRVMD